MKELYTDITILSPPAKVWEVLTDFDSYPDWNPFIRSINGEAAVGGRIEVTLALPDAKPMKLKPRVLRYSENEEFRWAGNLGIPGIFDGEHIFELKEDQDGNTAFIQRERFRGILVPFLKKMLDNGTRHGFIDMNTKLKELCEN